MNRFARDFLERSHPSRNFDQSAATQRNHAALDGLLFQFQGGGAHQDQFADLVVDLHDLVQSAAALVSRVIADSAAFALLDLDGLGFLQSEACVK